MAGEASLFDAIVVGSGASGGWACKRLAEAGLKVAVLAAGKLLACAVAEGLAIGVIEWCYGCRHKVGSDCKI